MSESAADREPVDAVDDDRERFALEAAHVASFSALALGFGFTFLVTAPLTTTLLRRLYGFGGSGLLGGAFYNMTGGHTLALAIPAGASLVARPARG